MAAASPRPPSSRSERQRPQPPPGSRRLGALKNAEDKAQTAKNTAAVARVLEHGEALVSSHESTLVTIANKIAQVDTRLDASHAAVKECEDTYRWTAPCGWDFDQLVKKHEFKLSVSEIATLTALGSFDPTAPRFALQELLSAEKSLSRGRLGTKRGELQPVDEHFAVNATDSVVALYEYLHADVLGHAREELSRTDAAVSRLIKQVNYLKQQRADALRDGDVVAAERHHRGMIDTQTELLEVLNARHAQLALSANDTNNFRGQARKAIDEAQGHFDEIADHAGRLQAVVEADLAHSEAVRSGESKTHRDASAAHTEYVRQTEDRLKANGAEQRRIFAEIQRLAQQMQTLSEERLDLSRTYTETKKAEEIRIANFNEVAQVQADHLAHLQRIKDLVDGYVLTSAGLNEYLATMRTKIEEREIEADLVDLTVEEAKRYLAQYRHFIFTAGDLATRKELRIETLQRQRRLAQHQQDTALDSFDPDAHEYATRQAKILANLEQCQAEIASLRAMQSVATEKFEGVEEVLRKHGVEYAHPVTEFGDQAIADRQRYVDKTLSFISSEETVVERSRENLKRLEIAVKQSGQQRALAGKTSSPDKNPAAAGESPQKPLATQEDAPAAAVEDTATGAAAASDDTPEEAEAPAAA